MTKFTVETTSPNAGAVYEVLQNATKPMTIKDVATSLGLTSAKVLGLLTSWNKKGYLTQVEAVIEGKPYKTYSLVGGVELEIVSKAGKTTEISEKGQAVLKVLESNTEPLTAAEVAEILGGDYSAIGINGVVNGLVKRDLVERVELTLELPNGEVKVAKGIVLKNR